MQFVSAKVKQIYTVFLCNLGQRFCRAGYILFVGKCTNHLCSFAALAEVLGSKVCLSRDKYNTMCCLESEEIRQRITTDWKAAQVHVLPMMQLSFDVRRQQAVLFSDLRSTVITLGPWE